MNTENIVYKVPAQIKIACIILIMVGIMIFLGGISIVNKFQDRWSYNIILYLLSTMSIIGCALLIQGFRIFKGKAKDTLGLGIGGMLLLLMTIIQPDLDANGVGVVFILIIFSACATLLILRGKYKRYVLEKNNHEKV